MSTCGPLSQITTGSHASPKRKAESRPPSFDDLPVDFLLLSCGGAVSQDHGPSLMWSILVSFLVKVSHSFHGARMRRLSILSASGSFTNRSLSGSHFSLRPSIMAMLPM